MTSLLFVSGVILTEKVYSSQDHMSSLQEISPSADPNPGGRPSYSVLALTGPVLKSGRHMTWGLWTLN